MTDEPSEPDFSKGVRADRIPDSGILPGTLEGQRVLLVRGASGLSIVGAECTHLGAPLEEGILDGDRLRCPWHHACFHVQTGDAVAAPAFEGIRRWRVVQDGAWVRAESQASTSSGPEASIPPPPRVVIVGSGAAGYATADALQSLGYGGEVVMVSADQEETYDRTLLSKDFMKGEVGEDMLAIQGIPIRDRNVQLNLRQAVASVDAERHRVVLEDGNALDYGKLVLATGASPKTLSVPGQDREHVHTLRSAQDARRILSSCRAQPRVAVVGGSFIGMEVAASLRSRGCSVRLIAPEAHPFRSILGADLSDAVVQTMQDHGVELFLGSKVAAIHADRVELEDGREVGAELVVLGVGVEPRTELAESAGLAVNDGVPVDRFLRTEDPDIFAVGDLARWPDPHCGQAIRVEHWNVATRQGQVAASNLLGRSRPFNAVPFFWTEFFDLSIRYTGHAPSWDEARLEGSLEDRDAEVRFFQNGKALAVATVNRDEVALDFEIELERRLPESLASMKPLPYPV